MLRSRAPIEPIANDIICVLYIIHTVVCVRNTIHDNRTNLCTNGACYSSNANSFICNKITYISELHKPLNGHRSMVFGRWCVNRKRGSDLSPFSVFSTYTGAPCPGFPNLRIRDSPILVPNYDFEEFHAENQAKTRIQNLVF